MTSPTETSPLLFAEDLAIKYNMPRQRARRWLEWLEMTYGHAVVGRFIPKSSGIRRYTTEAALESIGPAARSKWAEFEEKFFRIGNEVRALRREVARLTQRLNKYADTFEPETLERV